jgi:aryl-alcohol dehydrogenase-like predicted oxidoreductase
MRLKKLGNTGLLVSEICLGTMTFGQGDGMWRSIGRLEQPAVDEIVRAAFDSGVRQSSDRLALLNSANGARS